MVDGSGREGRDSETCRKCHVAAKEVWRCGNPLLARLGILVRKWAYRCCVTQWLPADAQTAGNKVRVYGTGGKGGGE